MNKKAFTLIEIMIVVGIIALLATIAMPSLIRNNSTAKTQACISNLHYIELTIQQWAIETRQSDAAVVNATDILPYLKGNVICPSGGKTFADSYSITFANVNPTCLKIPKYHRLPDDTTQ